MSLEDLQESQEEQYPLVEDADTNIVYCCACDTYATR